MTAARKLTERKVRFHGEPELTGKRKPGRPPNPNGPAPTIQMRVQDLRRYLFAIERVLETPRSAKLRQELRDAAFHLADRLGPASDPAWVSEKREPVPRVKNYWTVRSTEGWTRHYRTGAEAAEAYGIKPGSLSAQISASKDKQTGRTYYVQNPATGEHLPHRLTVSRQPLDPDNPPVWHENCT